MTDPATLLRMLEPAVRPVPGQPSGAPSSTQAHPSPTFESQTFDQLLQQAQTLTPDATMTHQTNPIKEDPEPIGKTQQPATPLHALLGVDRIENQALRQIIAHH